MLIKELTVSATGPWRSRKKVREVHLVGNSAEKKKICGKYLKLITGEQRLAWPVATH